MKNLSRSFYTALASLLLVLTANVSAFAQLDVDIDLDKNEWYENPIVWVAGALFLLILALIARGRK